MSTPDEPRAPRAVALGYRPDRDAVPRVLARGAGPVAARILAAAEAHGVPVQRDADLLACLDAVDLGDEIPPAAYAAVAGVLAFLLEARDRFAGDASR